MAHKNDWLKYRAKDGILKLHLDADGGLAAFSELITEAIKSSEKEEGEYCLMDTFLSDSLSSAHLELIFQMSHTRRVKILLADPNSYFARHRATTLGKSQSFQRNITGLERIAEALKIDKELVSPVPGNAADLEVLISQIAKDSPIELRFYSDITNGPLYFFKNLVLSGHFSVGKSAVNFPWLLIVNDPNQSGDFFDELQNEFDTVWRKGYEKPKY